MSVQAEVGLQPKDFTLTTENLHKTKSFKTSDASSKLLFFFKKKNLIQGLPVSHFKLEVFSPQQPSWNSSSSGAHLNRNYSHQTHSTDCCHGWQSIRQARTPQVSPQWESLPMASHNREQGVTHSHRATLFLLPLPTVRSAFAVRGAEPEGRLWSLSVVLSFTSPANFWLILKPSPKSRLLLTEEK